MEVLPEEWQIIDDYSSHRPLLYKALKNTEGTVVELGCGYGSTVSIRKYCNSIDRRFVSLENDIEWCRKFEGTFNVSNDYNEAEVFMPCGLLFIDCRPGELRKDLIREYANKADVIVIHDTEDYALRVYEIEFLLPSFKHRIDYRPPGFPGTTAISNKIDLSKW